MREMIGLSKSRTILRAFMKRCAVENWGSEQAASCLVHAGSKPLQSTLLSGIAIMRHCENKIKKLGSSCGCLGW